MSNRVALVLALLLAACASSHSIGEPSATAHLPERSSSASLAIDAVGLYWVDPALEAVVHAPLGGGPGLPIASAHPSVYAPITLTDTDVVWGDRLDGRVRVMRAPRAGGRATLIGDGNGGPIGIGVGAGHVYFSREAATFDLLDLDLATSRERVVAVNAAALGIVVDGADLIVTRCADGGLARVALDTGASTTLAPTYCPVTLALDGDEVFFSDYAEPTTPGVGGLAIFAAPAHGGTARRVTRSDGIAFAVHGGDVYTVRDHVIVRVSRDGTHTTPLAAARDVRGIAVDETLVYWTEAKGDGPLDLVAAPNEE